MTINNHDNGFQHLKPDVEILGHGISSTVQWGGCHDARSDAVNPWRPILHAGSDATNLCELILLAGSDATNLCELILHARSVLRDSG